MHYLSGETPTAPFTAQVRIRYKAPEQEATVTPLEGNRARVTSLHTHSALSHLDRPPSSTVVRTVMRCCVEVSLNDRSSTYT